MGTTCQKHTGGAANDPTNTFWHIPDQAAYAGGQSDMFFTVWDQTTNKMMSLYTTGSGVGQAPIKLQHCTATTEGSACSMFEISYCNMADYSTDKGYQAGNGAGDSLGDAPAALVIHADEWIAGTIRHALYLNTNCEASTAVFPSAGHAFVCPSDSGHPPHGSLYFLDYTDAQVASMNLPPWQKPIILAMSHYGGYVGDTDGSTSMFVTPNRYEAGEAYTQAGTTNPLYAWLDGQNVGHHTDGTSQVYSLSMWGGIPDLEGPNCLGSTCGVSKHAHIADPCVAQEMAGVAGGCP